MRTIVNLVFNIAGAIMVGYVLPGVHFISFLNILALSAVVGAANILVKPAALFGMLPATPFTGGLLTFLFDAAVVFVGIFLIPGLSLDSFWWALVFALMMALINSFLLMIRPRRPRQQP